MRRGHLGMILCNGAALGTALASNVVAASSAKRIFGAVQDMDGEPVNEVGPGDHELDKILRHLASLARLYADGALGFTCDDLISYRRSGYPGGKINYRCVYRRFDGKLEDCHTCRKPGNRPVRTPSFPRSTTGSASIGSIGRP